MRSCDEYLLVWMPVMMTCILIRPIAIGEPTHALHLGDRFATCFKGSDMRATAGHMGDPFNVMSKGFILASRKMSEDGDERGRGGLQ